jgi:hypothetical protein
MLAFSAVVPTDPMMSARPFAASLALWLGAFAGSPLAARQPPEEPFPPPGVAGAEAAGEEAPAPGLTLDWGLEAKAHYRSSDSNRFPVPFSFDDPRLPPVAGPVFLETASPGDHLELSAVTLFADAAWGSAVAAHAKIDLVDLYDRNPTSGDRQVDVDEAWLRFGRETAPAALPAGSGAYLKVGKLPKLERQDDRHLESYGLVSTAFNRFEDLGIELGIDLGRHLYLKATATQGNPLFLRDPNALAGDNGTEERLRGAEPPFGSGVPILYDAEVEDVDADGELEAGAALGLRFADASGSRAVDLLLFGYRRDLAETVDLEGTIYGGDLDLLRGPFDQFPYPGLDGARKEEVGANLWLYLGGLSLFGQVVDQELAGLPRRGWEAEVAWAVDLPLVWAAGGSQLFPFVQPAVRWSRLDNDFANPARTPFPSGNWDWEKLDAGLRLGIVAGVDLSVEYAANRFETAAGRRENDELLTTLRWAR